MGNLPARGNLNEKDSQTSVTEPKRLEKSSFDARTIIKVVWRNCQMDLAPEETLGVKSLEKL